MHSVLLARETGTVGEQSHNRQWSQMPHALDVSFSSPIKFRSRSVVFLDQTGHVWKP
eukprot:COSAG02_NODE_62538_length_265_cov_1.234940_1_plen_56_part_01